MIKNARTKLVNIRNKVAGAAAVATAALYAGAASAGPLADAASEGMDNAELYLIGAAVLTLSGVVVLIRKGQRAAGG